MPGVVELLRAWFDVGGGRCDPDVAERRATELVAVAAGHGR